MQQKDVHIMQFSFKNNNLKKNFKPFVYFQLKVLSLQPKSHIFNICTLRRRQYYLS